MSSRPRQRSSLAAAALAITALLLGLGGAVAAIGVSRSPGDVP